MIATDWRAQAACRGKNVLLWFPVGAGNHVRGNSDLYSNGRVICAGCPVKAACLDYALSLSGQVDGLWGGLDEHERAAVRRRRRPVRRAS